jgi:ATP-dependent DNA helicase RecQ
MRAYVTKPGCRMAYLRAQLDDPEASPCGRCDRCTGVELSTHVSESSLAAAQTALGKLGIELPPKKLWPTGMSALGVPLTGKLRTPHEPGRALSRLSDLGWGTRLRALFSAPDADIPEDVFRAVVELLAAWKWDTRPTQVVWVPSDEHPQLVAGLATRIARVGRLRAVGPLRRVRESTGAARSNSAQRLKAVYGAFTAEALELDQGPLLLVDARTESGWTMTEATRVLREAGSGPVLPLVLAVDA